MKRIITFLLLVCILSLTGCDGLRRLAGRPTGAELADKQARILAVQEAKHQARIDSMRRIEQALADSLAVLDSLKQMRGTILNPAALGGLYTTKLDFRYYIVVGALTVRSNAEKLLQRVQDDGYVATLISFRNGYNAVGVSQTDHLPEAYAALKKVKEESFCPPDVWILVNE